MSEMHIEASKAKIPMGRFLQDDEVASMVAWIVGPECSFTTGFVSDLPTAPDGANQDNDVILP